MPNKCAVVGCHTNYSLNKSKLIRFFSFPHNPNIRQKWIDACDNPKMNPNSSFICDLHFKYDDYEFFEKGYLLHTAVPKTALFDPLCEGTIVDVEKSKCEIKEQNIEFIDMSSQLDNNTTSNAVKLSKDSSIQCNLFEEIFNQEFENYSINFKFSIDEIAKLLGITKSTKLYSVKNEESQIELGLLNKELQIQSLNEQLNDSDSLESFWGESEDFTSNNIVTNRKRNEFQNKSTLNERFQIHSLNEQLKPSESNGNESLYADIDNLTSNNIVTKRKSKPRRDMRKRIRDLSKQNFILLPNNAGYKCEICYKTCLNLAAYYAHHDSHLEQSTICSICGWNSTTTKKVVDHERFCSGKIGTQFQKEAINQILLSAEKEDRTCQICYLKFGKYVTYMDHMNIHNNIKPYTCSCSRKYAHYSNFLQHIIKFKCPVEGRIIPDYVPQTTEVNNETFIENASNCKRFHCPICNSDFFGEKYFKHFSEIEHMDNEKLWTQKYNIEKFQCKYCKFSIVFEKLIDCINHCREVHNKIPNSHLFKEFGKISIQNKKIDNSKLIQCSKTRSNKKYCAKCDKYFVKRITFLDHLNIHENTYPYICSCGEYSRFYEEFLKHIRRNKCKGEIIFPDYAPQTFANNSKQVIKELDNKRETMRMEVQSIEGINNN